MFRKDIYQAYRCITDSFELHDISESELCCHNLHLRLLTNVFQDELEKKYVGLVQSYGADLKTVQELFLQNRDFPPISWNLPPIAGALTWCRGLVDRIQIPMAKLQQLDRTILDREEAKEVAKVSKPGFLYECCDDIVLRPARYQARR